MPNLIHRIQSLAQGIDQITAALAKSAAGYDATAIREQIFESDALATAGGEAKQYDITGPRSDVARRWRQAAEGRTT
jgi:hypothetical protein